MHSFTEAPSGINISTYSKKYTMHTCYVHCTSHPNIMIEMKTLSSPRLVIFTENYIIFVMNSSTVWISLWFTCREKLFWLFQNHSVIKLKKNFISIILPLLKCILHHVQRSGVGLSQHKTDNWTERSMKFQHIGDSQKHTVPTFILSIAVPFLNLYLFFIYVFYPTAGVNFYF